MISTKMITPREGIEYSTPKISSRSASSPITPSLVPLYSPLLVSLLVSSSSPSLLLVHQRNLTSLLVSFLLLLLILLFRSQFVHSLRQILLHSRSNLLRDSFLFILLAVRAPGRRCCTAPFLLDHCLGLLDSPLSILNLPLLLLL
ncbi:hypothetical protein PFISCL1PPCAC_561, partial [Pristionchus fissidentatus]